MVFVSVGRALRTVGSYVSSCTPYLFFFVILIGGLWMARAGRLDAGVSFMLVMMVVFMSHMWLSSDITTNDKNINQLIETVNKQSVLIEKLCEHTNCRGNDDDEDDKRSEKSGSNSDNQDDIENVSILATDFYNEEDVRNWWKGWDAHVETSEEQKVREAFDEKESDEKKKDSNLVDLAKEDDSGVPDMKIVALPPSSSPLPSLDSIAVVVVTTAATAADQEVVSQKKQQ